MERRGIKETLACKVLVVCRDCRVHLALLPRVGGLHTLGEDHVSEWAGNRAGLQWKGCRN